MAVSIVAGILVLGALAQIGDGHGLECTEKPCKLNDTSIRFIVLGDWGGIETPPYVTKAQKVCASFISNISSHTHPQFFLSTGDNFYETGVKSVDDPRFKTTFDDVYLYGKDTGVPWYITGGNHDWHGNITAQMDYTYRNNRWIYPHVFYTARYDSHPNGPSVELITIDTIVLCGNTWHTDRGNQDGKDTFDPDGPESEHWAEEMWKWIEGKLANSTADYVFLSGHYPVFSSTLDATSKCLAPRLQELMEKYNATAYFSGHVHNLQHLTATSKSGRVVHYVISGAGHSLNANHKHLNATGLPWRVTGQFFFPRHSDGISPREISRRAMGGLVYVDVAKKSGSVDFYECNGKLLYSFDVKPRVH